MYQNDLLPNQDCLLTRPKSVVLLAMGESRQEYINQYIIRNNGSAWDETWAIGAVGLVYNHDKMFVMDDLRILSGKKEVEWAGLLKDHQKPIITSVVYPEFPMSVRYPIEDVVKKINDEYFMSTIAYAIGYALSIGVKELNLYGCDFSYPNRHEAESGGQNVAYLLGRAESFGMTFRISALSTLLSANECRNENGMVRRNLYGYAKQPFMENQ